MQRTKCVNFYKIITSIFFISIVFVIYFTEQKLNYQILLEHGTCSGACLRYSTVIKGCISLVRMCSDRPHEAFSTFFRTDTVLRQNFSCYK